MNRLPRWWIDFTLNHSLLLIIAFMLLTTGILFYTARNFQINTDLTDMISNKLSYRKIYKDYLNVFPLLTDEIVLVIDADTPEQAARVRKILGDRLCREKDLFKSVYIPGGGPFFEKNGLLYLTVTQLQNLGDDLAQAQPLLAVLSKDFSLNGLLTVLEKALGQSEAIMPGSETLRGLFRRLDEAMKRSAAGKPFHISWQDLFINGRVDGQETRQFIVTHPFLDYTVIYPAQRAVEAIRNIIDEMRIMNDNGLSVRLTGEAAINYEDLNSVRADISIAAIISFLLVGVVLYIGMRSMRLVLLCLITLGIGLIWTMGFAIAFIGSLNMISIAFAVLFIGLGIDYSIQLCLRWQEFVQSGLSIHQALHCAVADVSRALLLCTITTAIGFYAFVPTAYAGASELGLISGTGMFINLITNLTLLPALLNTVPLKPPQLKVAPKVKPLSDDADGHARIIVAGAVAAAIAAAMLVPKVRFDFNPLNLSNPTVESVITAKDLFKNGESAPWTMSVLAPSSAEAHHLAERLQRLSEVEMVLTIADFVPDDQAEKIELVSDIALFMPPSPPDALKQTYFSDTTYAQNKKTFAAFAAAVKAALRSSSGRDDRLAAALQSLDDTLTRYNALLENPRLGIPALALLENGLLENLNILLKNFELLLEPVQFTQIDLPNALLERYISEDGRYRVQVFPHENIAGPDALLRFVAAVRSIAPDATDAPVTILESGKAIASAFKHASIGALAMIVIFLLIVLKNRRDSLLIITPLILGIIMTCAAAVLLDLPFNFANIIAVPLLLGIGVDYSIHLVHRWRTDGLSRRNGLLKTSASKGVVFSALTTLVSFGSLSFIRHRGTASMGQLLTLCILFMLLSVLVILPALLRLSQSQSIKS